MTSFDDQISALCAKEASAARGDAARLGAMVERLARALGFTVAMAAGGDEKLTDKMMQAAEAYAHEEAVSKGLLARLVRAARS